MEKTTRTGISDDSMVTWELTTHESEVIYENQTWLAATSLNKMEVYINIYKQDSQFHIALLNYQRVYPSTVPIFVA